MREDRQYVLRAALATVLFGIGLVVSALNTMGVGPVVSPGNMTPKIVFAFVILAIGRWGQLQLRRVANREQYFRSPSRATRERGLIWGFWTIVIAGNFVASRFPGGISSAALLLLGMYTIWVGTAEALNREVPLAESPADGGWTQRMG